MKTQANSALEPMIENQRVRRSASPAGQAGAARSVRRVAPIAPAGEPGGISRNGVSLQGEVKPVRFSGPKPARQAVEKISWAPGERGQGRDLAGPGDGAGDRTAASCANWDDGCCHVCGAAQQGYAVDPAFRCPGWRPR